jgi:Tol biopolymer transport system component
MFAFELITTAGRDVATESVRGGQVRVLTDDHRSGIPLWGPTGIAFQRDGNAPGDVCGACHGDVWLMHADGSSQRRLTGTGAGIYPAAWSADGAHLLAAYPAMHNGALYAVDVKAGHTRRLTRLVGELFAQGLSRDGQTVLAAIGCGGAAGPDGVLETLPFSGGKPTIIVRGPCRGSWNA